VKPDVKAASAACAAGVRVMAENGAAAGVVFMVPVAAPAAGVPVMAENGAAAGVVFMVPVAAPMVPAAAGRGAPRPRWQPVQGPRRSVRLQDERGKRRAHRTN